MAVNCWFIPGFKLFPPKFSFKNSSFNSRSWIKNWIKTNQNWNWVWFLKPFLNRITFSIPFVCRIGTRVKIKSFEKRPIWAKVNWRLIDSYLLSSSLGYLEPSLISVTQTRTRIVLDKLHPDTDSQLNWNLFTNVCYPSSINK